MRLIAILPLCFACTMDQDACSDAPAWTLTDVVMELDNLTHVVVVGRAEPVRDDENPAAVVVVFEGYEVETDTWTTVRASAALDPDGGQEFVVATDEVRYWPGTNGYDEVCAVIYVPESTAEGGDDLGCLGDQVAE